MNVSEQLIWEHRPRQRLGYFKFKDTSNGEGVERLRLDIESHFLKQENAKWAKKNAELEVKIIARAQRQPLWFDVEEGRDF